MVGEPQQPGPNRGGAQQRDLLRSWPVSLAVKPDRVSRQGAHRHPITIGDEMRRKYLKTRERDGGEFSVIWDDGWCQVGLTSRMDVHGTGEDTGIGAHPEFSAHELDDLIATLQRARREAYGDKPPLAVTMEIVERGRTTDDTTGGSLILPSDVRINGVSVLTGGGVKVHEMDISPCKEMAKVTVTLPVRLLVIGAEGDLDGGPVADSGWRSGVSAESD